MYYTENELRQTDNSFLCLFRLTMRYQRDMSEESVKGGLDSSEDVNIIQSHAILLHKNPESW